MAPAGALGALARHATGRLLATHLSRGTPWGVLTANLLGALLLGLLAGAGPGRGPLLVLGAGFLGAYTTFSTWMVETDALARTGRYTAALLNVVVPVVGGFILAATGFAVGLALW